MHSMAVHWRFKQLWLGVILLLVNEKNHVEGCSCVGVIVDGNCYIDHGFSISTNDARSQCQAIGGTLPIIKTTQQWNALENALTSLNLTIDYIWLGLTDSPFDQSYESPYKWIWDDNICWQDSHLAWGYGQPNGGSSEQCARARVSWKVIFDYSCASSSSKIGSICVQSCDGTISTEAPNPTPNCSKAEISRNEGCSCAGAIEDGNCYIDLGIISANDARSQCQAIGGSLPIIKTSQQCKALQNAKNSLNSTQYIWLGLTDSPFDQSYESPYKWIWDDNICWQDSYLPWHSSHPNGGSSKQCAIAWVSGIQMNSEFCTRVDSNFGSICVKSCDASNFTIAQAQPPICPPVSTTPLLVVETTTLPIELSTAISTSITTDSSSGKRKALASVDDFVANSRSIIDVPGDDRLCLPRALATAIAYVDNDPQWNSIRRGNSGRCRLQLNRATELMEKAGLGQQVGPWDLGHVQQFQDCLQGYQIKIFRSPKCDDTCFDGPPAEKTLNLYLHNEHYMVVTKMAAFLNTNYYCSSCNKSYDHEEDHMNCKETCRCCFRPKKCLPTFQVSCNICNRWFVGRECFDSHRVAAANGQNKRAKKMSICDKIRRCKDCSVEFKTRIPHTCNTAYCRFCEMQVAKWEEHQCYMKSYEPKEGEASGYIFFDFETQQTKAVEPNKYGSVHLHEPICVVVQKVCVNCWKERDMSVHCENCDTRQLKFLGSNLLDNFVKWLFSSVNRGCIAMAHNNKGYDGQLILESLHRNAVQCPEMIFKGLEIMRLKLNGVTLLDSLNFLAMPLGAMPAAFNLVEMKKGYFPHLFSSMDNWNYSGQYPDAYFYQPATMKQGQKQNFFEWYFANRDKTFDFKKELLAYCESDVDILKMGVMSFRDTFLTQTGLDPYWNSMTISDACIKVFRMKFLPEATIGLLPLGEYRVKDRYSVISIKWIRWVSQQENRRIQHAVNGGEVRVNIGGKHYKVDGLDGSQVLEFQGCAWHGCQQCFQPNTLLPLNGKRAKEAHQETFDKNEALKKAGFSVVEMWECQLRRMLKTNTQMANFFAEQKVMEPMKSRDAYFGGRTNCAKLYHKAKDGEKIQYIDICSLYPYVLKYGVFPTGHPSVLTENFKDVTTKPYQGLIKCRVLPPKQLYHPVLPARIHGKLMFPLCNTCAELRQRDQCDHTDEEKSFWGSWVTLELYKAMDLGYKVLEIAEVWDYSETKQYSHGQDTNAGLFTEYINEFLQLKQEASDWPKWCKTDEDKAQYMHEYADHEGILLNRDNVKKNPALRALAKLCLNSFYGKFGQRNNMPKTKCVNEPADFFRILADPTNEVKQLQVFNDRMVQVTYCKEDGFEDALPNVNVVIAAYVTAQARLKLYEYLELLQKRVLYFDTDSIVYVQSPGCAAVPTGSYLGDMTNELEDFGENAYICEFASCGPKNYAFNVKCSDGKIVPTVKIRGFTLDSIAAKRLNMNTLKQKIFAYVSNGMRDKTVIVSRKIVRSAEGHLKTAAQCKSYSLVFDKRYVTRDYMSYPYGF